VKTVFLSFLASMVMAQSAGTFTATGKMTWPRFRNTAARWRRPDRRQPRRWCRPERERERSRQRRDL
jgi:hypothetical protein